ncbi:tetratricopeptide repeat protein [Xenorhabdus bovienii]|uniref:tetratricopeptide repeat protein n=2 Tax=Xenorhabdus bovienii TaxID=40576 RepID=UPI00237CE70C|nr:tetratricopeptide repeat protein [Xenorhabdus bovienii]MDE1482842.1 sel1 repeat family protein [Xenorhabdus bovienii]MDE1488896.1 sel1 repeat family protein [Xenorhabdus bovienii]MDE9428476.1 sel1 repeat family protein [Xenorhabdus bovienii]MDE9431340.1 sel1 repeat family protein [Xenorhabdus bovienii]MDE9434522.1 sel1 repeat family protein [Xenorhabdus bovienii]
MKKKSQILFAVFLLIITTACYSESNGSENFNVKITQMDEKTHIEILHALANSGHIGAQYELGTMYAEGKGVKQDYIKAKDWYEKAALQGDIDSQASLGFMYYNAEGIPQDYIKAKEWFEKAAAQGSAASQAFLGIMYYVGEGAQKDYGKAKEWFKKSCDNGYQVGCESVTKMNIYGE